MDTSETYVKMCQKAREIQVIKPFQGIQIYWHEPLVGMNEIGNYYAVAKGWLPRQDQLQEMIIDKPAYGIVSGQLIGIQHFAFEKYFDSWEQLWLAFVMKEKYNKAWNGEEWILLGS